MALMTSRLTSPPQPGFACFSSITDMPSVSQRGTWCSVSPMVIICANSCQSVLTFFISKDKDKFAKWKTFQQSKDVNVFIGQIASGGIGIELFKLDSLETKSQHMIFYENTWSLDVREQAMGRIHRIGQKSTCIYHDITIKDTIDVKMLDVLKTNKSVADAIIEKGVEGFLG